MRRLLFLPALLLAPLAHALGIGEPVPPLRPQVFLKGSPPELSQGLHVVAFWNGAEAPPKLNDLASRLRGKADLTAVNVGGKGDDALMTTKRLVLAMGPKMDYTVAFDGEASQATGAWLVPAHTPPLPYAFLVKDGKLQWAGDPAKGLDAAVDATLKGTFDLAAARVAFAKGGAVAQADADKAKKAQAEMAETMRPLVEAMQARDPVAGLKAIESIEAKRPDLKKQLEPTRFSIYIGTADPRALDLAKRFVAEDFKDDADTLNTLAWSLIDPKAPLEHPNDAAALILAKRAAEASGMKDGQILDTYALALYRTGDKKAALALQIKALALVKADPKIKPDTVQDLQSRLDTYRKDAAGGKA